MASVGFPPTSSVREPSAHAVEADTLHDEMNGMTIRDDKVCIHFGVSICIISHFLANAACVILVSRRWKPLLLMVMQPRQAT